MGSEAPTAAGLSGEELCYARRLVGLTQDGLGARVGVSGQFIGHCEAGRKQVPAALRERLMEALRPTGDDLRAARQRVDCSQAALAATIGVWPATVGTWERGVRSIP